MAGDDVSVSAVAEGATEVDITATDPHGATATEAFLVTVTVGSLPPSSAPRVSVNANETYVEVQFDVSFAPSETKAFRTRIRQKTDPSVSRTYCASFQNNSDETVHGTITVDIYLRLFALANTTYLVDYRHVGEYCSDTATAPWSDVAEFTTTDLVAGGDFDIDLAFVDPAPSDAVESAIKDAARVWEQAILDDLPDHDLSTSPRSNACTDGVFDGVVDDLRIYVRVQSIDGSGGTLATAGVCTFRVPSGLPLIARITLDSDDVGSLGPGQLYDVALHEIAHALGFGLSWDDFLVDPSIVGGEPVTPAPDTHFDGANAIAAFDDAGGTDYEGKKVPVENESGGSGSQDSHWRKSVMGGELMTYSLSGTAPFSAITIQSMADLGYGVDLSVADPYTLPETPSQADAPAVGEDARSQRHCIVHRPVDVEFVHDPDPHTVARPPATMRVTGGRIEQVEPLRSEDPPGRLSRP